MSPSDFKPQAEMVKSRVQSGLDVIEERGGPLVDRYGRTALMVGVAALAIVGVAIVLARRRRSLADRVGSAMPDSVASRFERPVSSLRSAAGRISR